MNSITLLLIGAILLCLMIEAFFSASEMALISIDKIRLKTLVSKGSRAAKQIAELLLKPEWLLGTTLLGTNTATVMSSTLATYLVLSHFGTAYEYVAVLIMSPLVLIFAEIIPKTLAHSRSEQVALRVVGPLTRVRKTIEPLVRILVQMTALVTGMKQFSKLARTPLMSREDLEFSLRSTGQRGGLKAIERQMIHRIFEFNDTIVGEVMIPLIDVIGVQVHAKLSDVLEVIIKQAISRVPVYRDRVDNIVGVLLATDLLQLDPQQDFLIEKLIRPPLFVPTAMPINNAMPLFRKANISMAVVVDEYGGAVGIITAEDILEEVVGEIEDEFDPRKKLFRQVHENLFIVDARMGLKNLRDLLGLQLPEGDYDTLAGYILTTLKRIPKVGETMHYKRYSFKIVKANDRAIEEVQLSITP
jgi:CBS domain containing-hemolysin-like protein